MFKKISLPIDFKTSSSVGIEYWESSTFNFLSSVKVLFSTLPFPSVSFSRVLSWNSTISPLLHLKTSISIPSAPSLIDSWIDSMVFSATYPLAPRWPIFNISFWEYDVIVKENN